MFCVSSSSSEPTETEETIKGGREVEESSSFWENKEIDLEENLNSYDTVYVLRPGSTIYGDLARLLDAVEDTEVLNDYTPSTQMYRESANTAQELHNELNDTEDTSVALLAFGLDNNLPYLNDIDDELGKEMEPSEDYVGEWWDELEYLGVDIIADKRSFKSDLDPSSAEEMNVHTNTNMDHPWRKIYKFN